MDRFYIIVLSIAVVLLILILTIIGLMMKSTSTNSAVFPPTLNTCPDYWTTGMDPSSCAIPVDSSQKNTGSIYDSKNKLLLTSVNTFGFTSLTNDIKFGDPAWSKGGTKSICAQQKWANQYNIMWDGVTNYNGC